MYSMLSDTQLSEMAQSVFDDFPMELPNLSPEVKNSLILTSIKTKAVEFLNKALDDLIKPKPPTTE